MAGTTVRQYFGPSGKYYLDTQWSSSSNGSAANSSDVTVKVYVGAVGGWSAYTGATDLTIKIDGTTVRSGSSASVSINGSEQLMGTGSKTVGHDSDGTSSINISVTFSGGSYLGTGSDSFTAKLDTIARKSTMKNDADWDAGSNFTISITRSSSSFSHEAEIYVRRRGATDWVHIKQVAFSTSQTSLSTNFSTAEHKKMFENMTGDPGLDSYIILQTYKGSTWIGSNYYYGTVTAPDASKIATSVLNISNPGVANIAIYKSKSFFDHTVQVSFGSHNGPTSSMSSGTAIPATYTASSVYSQIPNSKTIGCTITLTTYYEGVKVRNSVTRDVTAYVVASDPIFSGSGVTYRDGVSSISAIMGTSPVTLVQNKSTLIVDIPIASRAIAQNSATMKTYSASVNGFTVTQTWQSGSIVTFNMGAVDLPSNATLTIKAKDSRGFETTITKTINIASYAPPIVNINAIRQNNFDAPTSISISGNISPVKVGTTMKNALVNISTTPFQVHIRENKTGVGFPAYEPLAVATNVGNKYTSATVVKTMDTDKTYVVEVQVKDKFGTYTSSTIVAKGIPIFSIDTVKNSIGFKSVPTQNDVFEMFGKMVFAKNQYATGTSNDAPIDFSNSDAVGINALYFNDVADNNGEGLMFPKSTASVDKTKPFVTSEWNNFRIMDDMAMMDGTPVFQKSAVTLWSGTTVGSGTTETKFKIGATNVNALDYAPNGLIFVFSDYNYVAGGTSVVNDYHWVHIYVPRWQLESHSGDGILMDVASTTTTASRTGYTTAVKYFYVTPTGFSGHADNNSGDIQLDVVLRAVITY